MPPCKALLLSVPFAHQSQRGAAPKLAQLHRTGEARRAHVKSGQAKRCGLRLSDSTRFVFRWQVKRGCAIVRPFWLVPGQPRLGSGLISYARDGRGDPSLGLKSGLYEYLIEK